MTSVADDDQSPRLELNGITKIYPSVIANDDVSLVVKRGEIHAVLGENGAGKSTLMKMIYGVTRPDRGEIKWEGEALQVENPAQARGLGIGTVFQHFSLFETLTVVENRIWANWPARSPRCLTAMVCQLTHSAWCTRFQWVNVSVSKSSAACCKTRNC